MKARSMGTRPLAISGPASVPIPNPSVVAAASRFRSLLRFILTFPGSFASLTAHLVLSILFKKHRRWSGLRTELLDQRRKHVCKMLALRRGKTIRCAENLFLRHG